LNEEWGVFLELILTRSVWKKDARIKGSRMGPILMAPIVIVVLASWGGGKMMQRGKGSKIWGFSEKKQNKKDEREEIKT